MAKNKTLKIFVSEGARLPQKMTSGAMAADIYAAESVLLPFGSTVLVPTGLFVAPEEGSSLKLYNRSGLGSKTVVLANGVGLIDIDYRGEIRGAHVYMGTEVNLGEENDEFLLSTLVSYCDSLPIAQFVLDSMKEPADVERFLVAFPDREVAERLRPLLRAYANKAKYNQGTWHISKGDRIGQLEISPSIDWDIEEVSTRDALGTTSRGEGGFGSTGV